MYWNQKNNLLRKVSLANKENPYEPMSEKKILVIDDQPGQLRIIKKILDRYGWQAVTTDSAEEAELVLDWGYKFSAILTDLKMPWYNGLDFCKSAKSKYPGIRVYALSGNLELFDSNELDEAGFDGVYAKPITLEIVEDVLLSIVTSNAN